MTTLSVPEHPALCGVFRSPSKWRNTPRCYFFLDPTPRPTPRSRRAAPARDFRCINIAMLKPYGFPRTLAAHVCLAEGGTPKHKRPDGRADDDIPGQ